MGNPTSNSRVDAVGIWSSHMWWCYQEKQIGVFNQEKYGKSENRGQP